MNKYQGNHFFPAFSKKLIIFLPSESVNQQVNVYLLPNVTGHQPVATSAGSKEITHVKQSDSTCLSPCIRQKSSIKPTKDTRQNK